MYYGKWLAPLPSADLSGINSSLSLFLPYRLEALFGESPVKVIRRHFLASLRIRYFQPIQHIGSYITEIRAPAWTLLPN